MRPLLASLGLLPLVLCGCFREGAAPTADEPRWIEYGIAVDATSTSPGEPYPWFSEAVASTETVLVEQPLQSCRLASASLAHGRQGEPALSGTVDRRDAGQFEAFTRANLRRELVLLVGGKVIGKGTTGDPLPGQFQVYLRQPEADSKRLMEALR